MKALRCKASCGDVPADGGHAGRQNSSCQSSPCKHTRRRCASSTGGQKGQRGGMRAGPGWNSNFSADRSFMPFATLKCNEDQMITCHPGRRHAGWKEYAFASSLSILRVCFLGVAMQFFKFVNPGNCTLWLQNLNALSKVHSKHRIVPNSPVDCLAHQAGRTDFLCLRSFPALPTSNRFTIWFRTADYRRAELQFALGRLGPP